MITSVCQSFGVFQISTPPDTPLLTNVFLCSMPSTFQVGFRAYQQPFFDFNSPMAATSVKVKASSFSKLIVSHMSVSVAFTGFNKFSKDFLIIPKNVPC